MPDFIPSLYYLPIRLHFRVKTFMQLPAYHGTVLHGIVGEAFRRSGNDVATTFIRNSMPQWIENPSLSKPPRPYIIIPPDTSKYIYQPNDDYFFDIVFIGNVIDLLEYHFFEKINELTIQKEKSRLELVKITNFQSHQVLKNKTDFTQNKTSLFFEEQEAQKLENIKIQFQTPFYLKNLHSLRHLSAYQLVRLVYQRLQNLSEIYCNYRSEHNYTQKLERLDEFCLGLENSSVSDFKYYKHKIDRFKVISGTVSYAGNFKSYFPLLYAGQYFNIGSAITFGFGKYKLA